MKFKNLISFHKKLAKRLGEDLVYSLALDNNEIFVVISTHKSKTKRYKDKEFKTMQSCKIQGNDFNEDVNSLVERIARLYENILEPYEPERDNIQRERTETI